MFVCDRVAVCLRVQVGSARWMEQKDAIEKLNLQVRR